MRPFVEHAVSTMDFIETRGNDGIRPLSVSFSHAILSPMCSFGGIYVPESLPALGEPFLRAHLGSDYKTLARAVLDAFELDIDPAVIDRALALYDGFDDPAHPVPVTKVREHCTTGPRGHSRTWPCSPSACCCPAWLRPGASNT